MKKFRVHPRRRLSFGFSVFTFFFALFMTVVNVVHQDWVLCLVSAFGALFAVLSIRFWFQSSELNYQLDERERRLYVEF